MLLRAEEFLGRLWEKHHGRKFTTLCGDGWGDNGKGCIESALTEYFEVCVRVSGGANTGRTAYIPARDGTMKKIIHHLVPIGWAFGKQSIIGDWELVDVERLADESKEIISIIGQPKAPLHISRRAPLHLRYHSLLESWFECVKGAHAVKTTGRGISPMIAGVDLRLGPLVGHLEDADLLRQWVSDFYRAFEPLFKEMAQLGMIKLDDYQPAHETERLLTASSGIKQYITDVDPILQDLAARNVPTLFGLTQGFGLHFKGTYPFNSATQTIAAAAAYCGGLPMKYFGPVIQVTKLFPTRVGAGPFPSGMWDRQAAEQFPKKHPEYFSELTDGQETPARRAFLEETRERINGGETVDSEKAQYLMVLQNELGATTKRGREVGWPDFHLTGSAAMVNGADCLALTRLDALSGLKFKLWYVDHYLCGGHTLPRPVIPLCDVRSSSIQPHMDNQDIDLEGVDLSGVSDEDELPPDIVNLIDTFETQADVPVGIISTSPGKDGKIFRHIA